MAFCRPTLDGHSFDKTSRRHHIEYCNSGKSYVCSLQCWVDLVRPVRRNLEIGG